MTKEKKNVGLNIAKKGLNIVLRTNSNSTGCYLINQPKAPKGLEKFRKEPK